MQDSIPTYRWRYDRHVIRLLAGLPPAANADVLAVGAVGAPPDPVSAVQEGGLGALAAHIVQQNQTDALAERPIQDHLSLTPEGSRGSTRLQPVCSKSVLWSGTLTKTIQIKLLVYFT